jgi:hypothetical protein
MKFTRRTATTAAHHVPENWTTLGKIQSWYIALRIAQPHNLNTDPLHSGGKTYHHPSLLVNFDQTSLHLLPKSNKTYAPGGADTVALIGKNDMRLIHCTLLCSATSNRERSRHLLPQVVYQGKTARSLPVNWLEYNNQGWHVTFTQSHWSDLTTLQDLFLLKLKPYRDEMIERYHLNPESKLLVQVDRWSVQTGKAFRAFHREKCAAWCEMIYIPPRCTPKLQLCDVMLNHVLKADIRRQFTAWLAECVLHDNRLFPDNFDEKRMLKKSMLRNNSIIWVHNAWHALERKHTYIDAGWDDVLYTFGDPWSEEWQTAASTQRTACENDPAHLFNKLYLRAVNLAAAPAAPAAVAVAQQAQWSLAEVGHATLLAGEQGRLRCMERGGPE